MNDILFIIVSLLLIILIIFNNSRNLAYGFNYIGIEEIKKSNYFKIIIFFKIILIIILKQGI